jgi:hypothetical protein
MHPSLRLARLSVCINPMDPRLATLIDDYIASVSSAVKLLERGGIARPESNTAWACADISQTGVLPGGVKYFKHGYGCAVHLKRGLVDFDFGERGEINGFDVWRLASFANERLGQYRFSSEKELEACFKAEASAGTLVYSGYILYYLRHAGAWAPFQADMPTAGGLSQTVDITNTSLCALATMAENAMLETIAVGVPRSAAWNSNLQSLSYDGDSLVIRIVLAHDWVSPKFVRESCILEVTAGGGSD